MSLPVIVMQLCFLRSLLSCLFLFESLVNPSLEGSGLQSV